MRARVLVLFLMSLVAGPMASGQSTSWTPVGDGPLEPSGLPVWVMLRTSHSGVLAGTDRGLFLHDGWSWGRTEERPLRTGQVLSLELTSDGMVWAGVWGYGFFRSIDGWGGWEPVPMDGVPAGRRTFYGLTELEGGVLLAHNSFGEVYAHEGEGPWTLQATLPSAVFALTSLPGGVAIASTSSGLHRSGDGGATWTPLAFSRPVRYRLAVTTDGAWIVGLNSRVDGEPALFRSEDEGMSWEPLGFASVGIGEVVVGPDAALYASVTSRPPTHPDAPALGLWRREDAGATWEHWLGEVRDDEGWPWTPVFRGLLLGDPSAPEESGLRRSWVGTQQFLPAFSSADGVSWQDEGRFPTRADVRRLVKRSETVLAASTTRLYAGSVWGDVWDGPVPGYAGGTPLALGGPEGESVWVANALSVLRYDEINRTTASVRSAAPGYRYDAALFRPDGLALVFEYRPNAPYEARALRSPDGGATWTTTQAWVSRPLAVADAPDGTLYLALGAPVAGSVPPDAGVWRSDDGGISWVHVLSGTQATAVSAGPAGVFATTPGGLARSDDGGASWTVDPAAPGLAFALENGYVLRADLYDGVFLSPDAGVSWQRADEGLGTFRVYDALSNTYHGSDRGEVLLATNDGVYRKGLTVSAEAKPAGPAAPPMVWPNPAAGALTARITLLEAGPVTVEVRDLLGRRVALLADGVLPAGQHDLRWQPEGASGVYVVVVRAAGAVQTQRVTVVH